MSNIRNIQSQKRHLFIDLSEESYGLLMKNQLQKSLEKILEAENQLYKKISKGQMKKFSTKISNMYYIKGLILDRMKDLPKSLLAYQRAFEENKKNKSICNNIGKVYLQLLNYEEAEKYLLWALQLDNKLLQAYVNLAYLYFEITDFDKCLMICNEALSRNIQDFMLFEYLGICNVIHRKNYSESLVSFYQYMNICNKNKFKPSYLSLYYMSYALLLESKYEESLKYIQSAIGFYPKEGEAYFLRAQVFYNLQKLEQAEQDITKYAQIKNIQLICVDSQINSHLSGIDDTQFERNDQKSDQIKELINQQDDSNNNSNINQNIYSDQKQISNQNQTTEYLKNEEIKDKTQKNPELCVNTNTEQNHLIQEEKLNIYFQMGLIFMQKANQISSIKDVDKLFNKKKLQQKAIQYFEEANSIQYQFQIVFNLGLLLEEIGQIDDSFQVLQKTVIKHFENSNDEFYLNSDNYHILNLLFLNIFKLNCLQKYQQNLNQILSYDETEQSKTKLSIDSKTATDSQDLQAINSKYFSDVIYPRKRKISVAQVKNIKESLSSQINQIKRNITLTKSQLIEIILHKLNQINKQKLILSSKQEQYKQTILDAESFISPQLQTQGFSIISEENIRTNTRTSYLQSCDDLSKLEQQRNCNQSDFQEDSQDVLDSPTSQSPKNKVSQDTNLQEDKESEMPNQQLRSQNSRGSAEANKHVNENQVDMCFRKMSSKGCTCSTENSDDKSNCQYCSQDSQAAQKLQSVNQNKKHETEDEEEEEEEEKSFLQDEENEEIKLQKQREQEKDKIIKNAQKIFKKQKKEQQERIQKLKLEANKKQEEEYKQEKQKLYDQIKLIQREYDDIIQQFKSFLNHTKNTQYQFFPQCIACNPLYRRSGISSRDESDSQKTQEDNPKSSQLESHQTLSIQEKQQNKQKKLLQISSSQSTNGEIPSPNAIKSKPKCECDKIKNQILNYNSFLKSKNFERDFFFAFKRVIKNTFLHSGYIIDSLYSKSSITISSLAELSLGFIPLFQSNLLQLDKDNSQIQIVSNEILVKKCYVILSLSDSVENLHQILDSLSAALSIYLSEYMQEYYHNTSECIYPDNWGDKMNQVLDLLKNSYEISFELLGESYAYFIFYQFFANFIDNEEVLIKYKEKHMQERAQFLFNFILSNIKFSPIEYFKTKMNPPKQVIAPLNLAPNPTRIKTNVSSNNTESCNMNDSHIKSVSNYGQSEVVYESSILRRSTKKQKKNSIQRQEKCLCNIY
ncbi:hypothetical protein ABPG72_014670 [Tetrahymena utriculariae]